MRNPQDMRPMMHGPANKTPISTTVTEDEKVTKQSKGIENNKAAQKTGLRPYKSPRRGTMRTAKKMPIIAIVAILAVADFGLQTNSSFVYQL